MAIVADATPPKAKSALVLLFFVAIFNYVDRSLLSVLQIPVQRDLGLTDSQLGALNGFAFSVVYAIAALPLARIVDRGHRMRVLACALAAWTVMTAFTGFATSFVLLMLFRAGVAIGEAASVPATHSIIADLFPPRKRGTAMAFWALAAPLGIMLGVYCGGWLGQTVGWRYAFMVIGSIGLILVPLLLLLPEPVRGQFNDGEAPSEVPSLWVGVRLLLSKPAFRLLIIATTLQGFSYTTLIAWLSPFYARVYDLPLSQVGGIAALVFGVGGGVGAFFGGVILDKLVARDNRWYGRWPALTALISVPLLCGQLLVPSLALSVVLGIFAFAAAASFIAPVNAAGQAMVHSSIRGLTSAMILVIPMIFGAGFGPFLIGLLNDALVGHFAMGPTAIRWSLVAATSGSAAASAVFFAMGRELGKGRLCPQMYPGSS